MTGETASAKSHLALRKSSHSDVDAVNRIRTLSAIHGKRPFPTGST